MNMDALRRNIFDVVQEGQIKLGYQEEEIRLYYPLGSLCTLLGEAMDVPRMQAALEAFGEAQRDTLGEISAAHDGERFELTIPPQGVAYIHAHTDSDGFLSEFIRLIERHGTRIGDVRALFERYSEHVHAEELHNGEFDYLFYFEDGVPSDFYYCITDEGCHLIYHRFTRTDYEAFGF